ncbi:carcinoembryonic antigen-related cell adhesion molecule 5-like [Lethenteron reissneri]|uniref:carcinoembryonic antigen-related cell adhesion molecule 5-like n=1 Tax=Lethenteron reissneri TaxID=7753 RepID=UPI002AB79324|nr:carcinoembryonic antigen-related cell adhesion molecule 5-like [Lethenteron reissneri]
MEHTWFVIPLVWATLAGPVAGVVVIQPPFNPIQTVNRDVLFNVSYSENVTDPQITWTFKNNIAQWKSGNLSNNVTHSAYNGRVEPYSNGSLLLKSVSLSDAGSYTVRILDFVSADGVAVIRLDVYGLVGAINVIPVTSNVTGVVGSNVLFSINYVENDDDPQITWTFTSRIAQWKSSNTSAGSIHNFYRNRVTLHSNGSLLLKNVALSDSGSYGVVLVDNKQPDGRASVKLDVYEVITDTILHIAPSQPTLGGSAVLQCSAANVTSNTGLSFTFYKYDAAIATLQPNGSSTNVNRSINNVTYGDRGNYSCYAENPVSNGMSASVLLELECKANGSKATLSVPAVNTYTFTQGADLLLSVDYAFLGKASVQWTFGGKAVAGWILPGGAEEPQEFLQGSGYAGRTTAYANGSLKIKSMQLWDLGSYNFMAVPCRGDASIAVFTLAKANSLPSHCLVSKSEAVTVAVGLLLPLLLLS